jgi:uncharacterized RDD family membrane protein YckC
MSMSAHPKLRRLEVLELRKADDGFVVEEVDRPPIAPWTRRVIAGAWDGGLIALSVLLFLITFLVASSENDSIDLTWTALAALATFCGLLYAVIWDVARTDMPGVRAAGLRLVGANGRSATRRARAIRHLAVWISVLCGGLGFLWAFLDRERLTWADRLSGTYPAPAPAKDDPVTAPWSGFNRL